MNAHLGTNRYGKSGIRLATVRRDGGRHTFTDLEIDVRLTGDFAAAHVAGDNAAVLPTDTMRGTCYALARRHGADDPVRFGRLLATRFLEAAPACDRVEVRLVAFGWERITVDGAAHPHAFRPAAGGQSTTTITQERTLEPLVTAGVQGLRLLKTTGSAFAGFLHDDYTTLPETPDRIMATTVAATWAYVRPDVEHTRLAEAVPATFSARFATHDDSQSVQHTLFHMGRAVIDAHAEVAWIRFRLPNEHHVPADLSPYGLDNPGAVFVVTDRPFGVIEGTVARDGAAPETAW